MESIDIIIICIGIVLFYLVLRFIARNFFRIIGILLIICVVLYLLFYWEGCEQFTGSHKFIVEELEEKFCRGPQADPVKCECIVNPIRKDIQNRFSREEIRELGKNRVKSLYVVFKSYKANGDEIKECLKENNREGLWEEFVKELDFYDLKGKLKSVINDLKSRLDSYDEIDEKFEESE